MLRHALAMTLERAREYDVQVLQKLAADAGIAHIEDARTIFSRRHGAICHRPPPTTSRATSPPVRHRHEPTFPPCDADKAAPQSACRFTRWAGGRPHGDGGSAFRRRAASVSRAGHTLVRALGPPCAPLWRGRAPGPVSDPCGGRGGRRCRTPPWSPAAPTAGCPSGPPSSLRARGWS